jgi:hypothetical protein
MLREYYIAYNQNLAFSCQFWTAPFEKKARKSILKQALQKTGIKPVTCRIGLGTAMLHIY